MGGIVYLICDPDTELYKIGVTRGSIERRMKKLQTGNGTKLHLVCSFPTEYPFRLEKMLHTKFTPKNVLNEWFCLSPEDVFCFEKTCFSFSEAIESLEENTFFNKHLK